MDPTEASLSALSTQLVSLGYLSRPLDLATLFLAPSLPAGASSKQARKHRDLLILQARAREQIAKCLWGMLEQRQTERETIETLLAREARANEEADRERKAADRARTEREAMGRQVEAEKARAKCVPAPFACFGPCLSGCTRLTKTQTLQGGRAEASERTRSAPTRSRRVGQSEKCPPVCQDAGSRKFCHGGDTPRAFAGQHS